MRHRVTADLERRVPSELAELGAAHERKGLLPPQPRRRVLGRGGTVEVDRARRNEEGPAEPELVQQRSGDGVVLLEPVVEGQRDVETLGVELPPLERVGERDDRCAILQPEQPLPQRTGERCRSVVEDEHPDLAAARGRATSANGAIAPIRVSRTSVFNAKSSSDDSGELADVPQIEHVPVARELPAARDALDSARAIAERTATDGALEDVGERRRRGRRCVPQAAPSLRRSTKCIGASSNFPSVASASRSAATSAPYAALVRSSSSLLKKPVP